MKSHKQIKAIIFDCDGTLADSEEVHFHAWKHIAAQHGYDLTHEEGMHYVGKSDLTIAQCIGEKVGIAKHHDLIHAKRDHFVASLSAGLKPIEATVAFVRKLVEQKPLHGWKIALASAAPRKELDAMLKCLGLTDVFHPILSGHEDLVHISDPEGVNKPKPYIYQHAAALLGFSPEECVVIEDSFTGVSAGVSAGCFTVAIPNAHTEHHDFSHAALKLHSLEGYDHHRLQEHFKEVFTSASSPSQNC